MDPSKQMNQAVEDVANKCMVALKGIQETVLGQYKEISKLYDELVRQSERVEQLERVVAKLMLETLAGSHLSKEERDQLEKSAIAQGIIPDIKKENLN